MQYYSDTIDLVAREPDRWLAHKSVVHLRTFLDGFGSVAVIGKDISVFAPLVNGFSAFISRKYADSWRSIFIKAYNDSESFDLYIQEWRAFLSEWQRSSADIDFEKRNIPEVNITKTLDHIELHWGMYFVYPSIGLLFSYLQGVRRSCACYTTGARLTPDIQDFEIWLGRKFGIGKTCRWDRMLSIENGFNEKSAFEQFFVNLKEYIKTEQRGKL